MVRPPRFAVTGAISVGNIGTLGAGTFHVANAINNRGEVIGTSSVAGDDLRAFYWTAQSGIVPIGTLGGATSQATAINESGVIVGVSETATGVPTAFLWASGRTITSLSTFGGVQSRATGINRTGDIVGTYMPTAFDPGNPGAYRGIQGFLRSAAGGFLEFPTFGSNLNFPQGISDSGRVVGMSAFTADPFEPLTAYSWTAAGGIQSLGSLGAAFTEHDVLAINARGVATGGAFDATNLVFRPFIWSASTGLVDLTTRGFPATVSAVGLDINVLGHVAVLVLEATGTRTPAVWIEGTGLYTLPTLGGNDGEIWGVNDLGEIVGWSLTGAGDMRPVVWRLKFAAEDRVDDVVATIEDMLAGNLPRAVDDELRSALNQLGDVLRELGRTPPDLRDAASELANAIHEIRQAVDAGLDPEIGLYLQQILCQATRELLTDAIDAAVARGGRQSDIDRALAHLALGDSWRDSGLFERAADEYSDGIRDANRA